MENCQRFGCRQPTAFILRNEVTWKTYSPSGSLTSLQSYITSNHQEGLLLSPQLSLLDHYWNHLFLAKKHFHLQTTRKDYSSNCHPLCKTPTETETTLVIYCLFLTQQSVLKEIILNLTFCVTFKTMHYSYKICCCFSCLFVFLFCFLSVFDFCCELARPLKPTHHVHIHNNHSSMNTGYNIVFTIIIHSYFSQLIYSLLVTIFYMTTVSPPPPPHPSTPTTKHSLHLVYFCFCL